MIRAQHFVNISGGKDSTAVACLMAERMQRRDFGNRPPRFIFADTGNEHELTLQHIAYLARTLGVTIETVRADFAPLFARRRESIQRDWPHERRWKKHSKACLVLQRADLKHAEKAVLREQCDCPLQVSPPVPAHLIASAVELMQPSGNPFLDMAMLHGRFPGSKSRFCTEELKLQPMQQVHDLVRMAGTPIIVWLGERADESEARAGKKAIDVSRCSFRAPEVLYRPIHRWSALDTFAIAKRHGLKPNPLYLQGMGRVGCMPCIMCKKGELREIDRRFPEHLARIGEWERIVATVSRFALTHGRKAVTFLPARTKGSAADATIDTAVEWSRTRRGGRQHDLLVAIEDLAALDEPGRCSSQYRLCE